MRASIREQQKWLLFIGDSDTRGLVFALLQLLATGAHGHSFAEHHPELWLGVRHLADDCSTRKRNEGVDGCQHSWLGQKEREDWLRRCLLDFILDDNGCLASTPASQYCLASHDGRHRSSGYVMFGRDYNLTREEAPAAEDLRVTFVGTESHKQTMGVLSALTTHLGKLQVRPTFMYVGVGTHFSEQVAKNDTGSAAALVNRVEVLGNLCTTPCSLIYGSVLGLTRRNPGFDLLARPLLSSRWRVLERDTSLSRLCGDSGHRGIKLTNGHAPHLVNYIDVQRLAAAGAFGRYHRTKQGELNRCVPAFLVRYSPWCAGFGSPNGLGSFLEAYWHFCFVEVVAAEAHG